MNPSRRDWAFRAPTRPMTRPNDPPILPIHVALLVAALILTTGADAIAEGILWLIS